MPTFKISISPFTRSDNTRQVRIRLTHNRQTVYIKTPYYVSESDIDEKRQFNFYKLFNSTNQFNKRVNYGLELICKRLKIEAVTTYHARHSFASIGRNECNIPVDEIDLALVHKDNYDMTDKYTKTDFTKIDRAVRAVLDYVYETKGGMKIVKMAN